MIPESRGRGPAAPPVRENVSRRHRDHARLDSCAGAGTDRSYQALQRRGRADPRAPASALSGGNQQKLLFARAILIQPSVLLADEPTRGIDVGAKRDIYEVLVRLAGDGMAILLISNEVEEILGLAHRVLVMRAGRLVAELEGPEMTEEAIVSAAFGTARTSAA
jgi:simple sugar transport system ATP-binding protein/ribose transport system ATP-binding protein